MITVFTPAYNRAHLLPRLYESLCRQTCMDFEWIVVDDGSQDNTEEVVQGYIAEGRLDISYIKQPNGGKHRAINRGVSVARGELFFIADSDDLLPADAIECVTQQYETVKDDAAVGGVCGLDVSLDGNIIGSGLPREKIICNSIDLRMRYGVTGDLKEVFRTDVMREFPFPEIDGERFCPEALVWYRIARKYELLSINTPIYIAEYQEGGLTDCIVRVRMQSPVATTTLYAEMLQDSIPFMQKVKAAINYWRFWFCLKDSSLAPRISALWLWLKPVGYLMHLNDLKTEK